MSTSAIIYVRSPIRKIQIKPHQITLTPSEEHFFKAVTDQGEKVKVVWSTQWWYDR